MAHTRRTGLRFRTAISFALLAFVLSMTLVGLTYVLAKAYLLPIREASAVREARANAVLLDGLLQQSDVDYEAVFKVFSQEISSEILVELDSGRLASSVAVDMAIVPSKVRLAVESGESSSQHREVGGKSVYIVGEPLLRTGGSYFEVFSFSELEKSLSNLLRISLVAAMLTTVVGASVGVVVSRRILKPLHQVSEAAFEIARGDLGTRLPQSGDPDLDPLLEAFNEMSSALETRIERELRYSSDVSHELRTPLTAIMNSVSSLNLHEDEFSQQSQNALRILTSQIENMRRLVLDLLELARLETSGRVSALEPLDLVPFVRSVVARRSTSVPVYSVSPAMWVVGDRERIERVLTNLLDNADRYAAGATQIVVEEKDGKMHLHVDDAGPGIDPFERALIFDRFSRGSAPIVGESDQRATGLGLAIVREHVSLMNASIDVSSSPEGGARFTVSFVMAT